MASLVVCAGGADGFRARAERGHRHDGRDNEIDLARSEQVRRMWPFLRDRRIDAYADLLKRYRD